MKKTNDNKMLFSPSDLTTYLDSPYASWMDRHYQETIGEKKYKPSVDPLLELLAKRGLQHESDYLEKLKNDYKEDVKCLELTKPKNSELDFKNTIDAMEHGYAVIFQAYLRRDNFHGYADFLVRVDNEKAPRGFYYEAWDTKLSRKVKPYFLIQLCAYSWMLEEMQGVLPEKMRVVLGDKSEADFLLAQSYSYFLELKAQFIAFQNGYTNDIKDCPDPASFSSYGKWTQAAKGMLEESDSLALVANMRKTQIKHLQNNQIMTLSGLATTELENVKGIGLESFLKLKRQAKHQLITQDNMKLGNSGEIKYTALTEDQGKGLSVLPTSNSKDIFFDIEGMSIDDGGLEYLWGVSYKAENWTEGDNYVFKDWWGHTPELEKDAFEAFVKWAHKRWLDSDQKMHIYHYASYEVTALNKLSDRYHVCQSEVQELLKNGALVDLYKIVRNGMVIGEPKYSIKNVEKLYRKQRNQEDDVSSGGDSIVAYDEWREANGIQLWQEVAKVEWPKAEDVDWDEPCWKRLKAIRDYNIDDCESTLELVGFLRKIMPKDFDNRAMSAIEYEQDDNRERATKTRDELTERQEDLLSELSTYLLENPKDNVAAGLKDILQFHSREYQAQVFETYILKNKVDFDLLDEPKALLTSELVSTEESVNKNGSEIVKLTFSFDPEQSTRQDTLGSVEEVTTGLKMSGGKFNYVGNPDDEIHSDSPNHVTYTSKLHEWLQVKDNLSHGKLTLVTSPESFFTMNLEKRLCDLTENYLNKNDEVTLEG